MQKLRRAIAGFNLSEEVDESVSAIVIRMMRPNESGTTFLSRYNGSNEFSTYIYTLVRNYCISRLKYEKRRYISSAEYQDSSKYSDEGCEPSSVASWSGGTGVRRMHISDAVRRMGCKDAGVLLTALYSTCGDVSASRSMLGMSAAQMSKAMGHIKLNPAVREMFDRP